MISTLAAATFSLLLVAGAEQATPSSDGAIGPSSATPASQATDRDIEDALFKLLRDDPERVVCAHGARTGTRMSKPTCGSVARWFNARHPADVAGNRAPWQLVDQIKKARRRAEMRRAG